MWSIVTKTNFEPETTRQIALINNFIHKSSNELIRNKLAFKNNKISKKFQSIKRSSHYLTEKVKDQFNTNFKNIPHYQFVQESNNQQFNKNKKR